MTNKEAKEKLYMEWQKFLEDNIDYAGISEAYKMAFKALGQEPCEDAISRILKKMWDCKGKHTTNIDKVKMEQIIRDELPSVNPQEPIDYKAQYESFAKKAEIVISQLRADRDRLADVFDKIRAEIMDFEEELFHRPNTDYSDYAAVRHCMEIIDKYKAESEDKE